MSLLREMLIEFAKEQIIHYGNICINHGNITQSQSKNLHERYDSYKRHFGDDELLQKIVSSIDALPIREEIL